VPDLSDTVNSGGWFAPEDCIWTGPKWLALPLLSSIPLYAPLKEFFVDILTVRNAMLTDILDHVSSLSDSDENPRELHSIYEHLATLAKLSTNDKEQIR
jgi:hypothetical protein